MRNFLISLGLLLILFGCGEKPCYEETDTFLNISFQTIVDSTGLPKDSIFDSLFVAGAGSPYEIKYTGSDYNLVLDLNNDSTWFNLGFNGRDSTDQIVFSYIRKPYLVSHECGFAMFFDSLKIEAFSTNFIDSVEIISNTVDDIERENVKIYL